MISNLSNTIYNYAAWLFTSCEASRQPPPKDPLDTLEAGIPSLNSPDGVVKYDIEPTQQSASSRPHRRLLVGAVVLAAVYYALRNVQATPSLSFASSSPPFRPNVPEPLLSQNLQAPTAGQLIQALYQKPSAHAAVLRGLNQIEPRNYGLAEAFQISGGLYSPEGPYGVDLELLAPALRYAHEQEDFLALLDNMLKLTESLPIDPAERIRLQIYDAMRADTMRLLRFAENGHPKAVHYFRCAIKDGRLKSDDFGNLARRIGITSERDSL